MAVTRQSLHKRVGHYIFLDSLSQTTFSGIYDSTFEPVAIKTIPRCKTPNEETLLEAQIKILKKLESHPNIIKCLGYEKTSNNLYIIFEYCKYGNLQQFIQDCYGGRVPEFEAQKIIQQIIEGIKAIKANYIEHSNLNLTNILIDKDFTLKISGFSKACFRENHDTVLNTRAGAPASMNPCILGKCDIWSLGVMFYQILVGKWSCNINMKYGKRLLQEFCDNPLAFPKDIQLLESVTGLIKSMLVFDNEKRMSFEELFSHEWVTGSYFVPDPSRVLASQLLQSAHAKKKINHLLSQNCSQVSNKNNVIS